MRRPVLAVLLLFSSAALAQAPPQPPPTDFTLPEPYFATGDGAKGVALMAIERWADARAALDALRTSKDAPTDAAGRARLDLLIARCDSRLGKFADAAAGFAAAAAPLPLLADYANYEAAVAFYRAGDLVHARERAEAVAPDAILAAEAQLLVGDVLRAGGKPDEIAAHYKKYIDGHPGGIRLAEARFQLAAAEEQRGHAVPALKLYRQILVEAPLTAWAPKAKERFDVLVAALPKKERAAYTTFTGPELVARGKVYFDAMRNELGEADFAAALKVKGLDKELTCVASYHRAQSVFKERKRAASAPLFDAAVSACAASKNLDLQVRSAYQGGRAFSAAGDHKKAITLFARAEAVPDHSFADDARLRQAEQWGYLEEDGVAEAPAHIEELLSTLPDRFPNGDMKGEALWRLAWRAWQAKKPAEALTWLDKEIAAVPHEENYYAEGQAHYWKGRAFDALGKPDDAREAYRRAVREYPLSYYSLLALNRLRERGELAAVLPDLQATPPGWVKGAPTWSFQPRPLWGDPGFQRAVELLRLGLGAEAERELARLGLRVPGGKAKVSDPDQAERLWATALLYDRARAYDKSHWIARWSVLDYKQAWPTDANRARWEIAYPRAWWHLLEPAAKAQGYPPELLISFVREESAFDPIMESFANAIGLTQMIFPTARRFGKELGFDISRDTLRDPEKNVAVGSRWLGFLWTAFQQNPGLIVAGYNAGEGAVWGWLCARGNWPYDEFGEAIPYDETRNYTKRVLSTYFAYSYLGDGTIPVVPNDIPAGAINAKKCGGKAPAPLLDGADKPDKP